MADPWPTGVIWPTEYREHAIDDHPGRIDIPLNGAEHPRHDRGPGQAAHSTRSSEGYQRGNISEDGSDGERAVKHECHIS